MECIKRSVKDIETADRRALEHVVGQHLSENQQVVIQVLNVDVANRDKCDRWPKLNNFWNRQCPRNRMVT